MDRRDFLKFPAGLAAHAAMHPLSASASPSGPPSREGIYTNRFTYYQGAQPIEAHISLLDVTSVELTFKHLDGPTLDAVAGSYVVQVDDTQIDCYAGIPSGGVGMMGPQFPVRIQIDTTTLEPGLYELSINPLVMRPENRESVSGIGFISLNSLCRFVVTPAILGSYSKILWLHDSLTGSAYGGFGSESIYSGFGTTGSRTISLMRPGLDRATKENEWLLRKFKADGQLFEYMDAVEFSQQSSQLTQKYDLIVVCGQFEYLPHSFFELLDDHIASGRNLLVSSNEFGTFRSRVDFSANTMTSYKYLAHDLDPETGINSSGGTSECRFRKQSGKPNLPASMYGARTILHFRRNKT